MNLKEMMLEYLRQEGFCPQENPFGLTFKCEEMKFLFFYDQEDDQYFRLMMPDIFEVTDENRDIVLEALNETNTMVKVVKAYVPSEFNSVWIGFEVLIDRTPELNDIVPRSICMLITACEAFYEALRKG